MASPGLRAARAISDPMLALPGSGPINGYHRTPHRLVLPFGDPRGDGGTHTSLRERSNPFLDCATEAVRNIGLANSRRLPASRQLVPNVVRIVDPKNVTDPTADEVRPAEYDVQDMDSAEVVANEVNRRVEDAQLVYEPVAVLGQRSAEPVRQRCAEPGWRQADHVVVPEVLELDKEGLPNRRSLWISVDEDRGHRISPHRHGWLQYEFFDRGAARAEGPRDVRNL